MFLTERADNFIFTFHNTNENCFSFVPLLHSTIRLSLIGRGNESSLPLENTQSHSIMLSWWSRTSNTKLKERDSPLSLSVWSSHSWPSGYHHGTGRRSHHWGTWHHWHVAAHRRSHSRSCRTKQRKGKKRVRKYYLWESLVGLQWKTKKVAPPCKMLEKRHTWQKKCHKFITSLN